MKFSQRLLWALAIFLLDVAIFILPVTAVLSAYILLARPPWFRDWIAKVYEGE